MYIKVTNGVVEKYPYSIGELRRDNPQTSFPAKPSDECLADWGVFPVKYVPEPIVDYTKNVIQKTPIQENDSWVQVWEILDASPEEIQSRTEAQAHSIRAERDQKLLECDWLVIKSVETEVPEIEAWKTYRQALRDVPQQPDFPWSVNWPEQP